MADGLETDKDVEIWKIKKLMRALESARGKGRSMISLIMPSDCHISRISEMLGEQYVLVSNIESPERQASLDALASAQQRLKKIHDKIPPNGLVLYTGTVVAPNGKEAKVTIEFEFPHPMLYFLYACHNTFDTEKVNKVLEPCDDKFGFVIMDENEVLFGHLSGGDTRKVLYRFTVDLGMEECRNYVQDAAKIATFYFTNMETQRPNIAGLILAGSVDFKSELSQPDAFALNPQLQAKILNVVGVSCGGEDGFDQAIELSSEILSDPMQEKIPTVGRYFAEICQDSGKHLLGVDDTIEVLESHCCGDEHL